MRLGLDLWSVIERFGVVLLDGIGIVGSWCLGGMGWCGG